MSRLSRDFKPKKFTPERAGFIQGFGYAVANLYRMHGDCAELRDLIKEAGYKLSDFRSAKTDAHDYETLEKIEQYAIGFVRPNEPKKGES